MIRIILFSRVLRTIFYRFDVLAIFRHFWQYNKIKFQKPPPYLVKRPPPPLFPLRRVLTYKLDVLVFLSPSHGKHDRSWIYLKLLSVYRISLPSDVSCLRKCQIFMYVVACWRQRNEITTKYACYLQEYRSHNACQSCKIYL